MQLTTPKYTIRLIANQDLMCFFRAPRFSGDGFESLELAFGEISLVSKASYITKSTLLDVEVNSWYFEA